MISRWDVFPANGTQVEQRTCYQVSARDISGNEADVNQLIADAVYLGV